MPRKPAANPRVPFDALAEATKSRAAQGLPTPCEDPAVYAELARILDRAQPISTTHARQRAS